MSDITRQDLKTILRFCIHLSRIDDVFHETEKNVLRKFSETIGLSEEERSELMGGDASLGGGLDSLSSEEAKELLMKSLCAVSYVDGQTSRPEVEFIERILARFNKSFFLLPKEDWGQYEDEVFNILDQVV